MSSLLVIANTPRYYGKLQKGRKSRPLTYETVVVVELHNYVVVKHILNFLLQKKNTKTKT